MSDIADPVPEGTPTGGETHNEPLVTFDTVHAEELKQIHLRRQAIFEAERARSGPKPTRPSFRPPREPEHGSAADEVEKARRVGALDQHLAGLALSGGGIRSATFAVGLLQALAHLRLLTRFDYLSTVSGGGYAGSWLTAWLKREGDVLSVQDQLAPSRVRHRQVDRVEIGPERIVDEEPEPLHHLRQYSNYLAPWKGTLTADTWTLLAIYARNTLINFFLLVPLTLFFALVAWGVVKCFSLHTSLADGWHVAVFYTFVGLLFAVFAIIGWQVAVLRNARSAARRQGSLNVAMQPVLTNRPIFLGIILPLIVCGVLTSWLFSLNSPKNLSGIRGPDWFMKDESRWVVRIPTASPWCRWLADIQPNAPRALLARPLERLGVPKQFFGINLENIEPDALKSWADGGLPRSSTFEFAFSFGILHMIAHLFGAAVFWVFNRNQSIRSEVGGSEPNGWLRQGIWLLVTSFISGASGGFLLFVAFSQILWRLYDQPWAIATFGPPLTILVFFVAVTVEVWLLGRKQGEDVREWWARVCALLLIAGVAWLAIMAILFYVPPVAHFLDRLAHQMVTPTLVVGWIMTSVGGALAGRSPRINGQSDGNPFLDRLAQVAPIVFLIGLLAATSALVGVLTVPDSSVGKRTPGVAVRAIEPAAQSQVSLDEAVRDFGSRVVTTSSLSLFGWMALSLLGAGIAGIASDANLFSLHNLYGNRLTRCYLGASRPKRTWHERSWRDPTQPGTAADAPEEFARGESQLRALWWQAAAAWRAWLPGPGGAPTQVGAQPRPGNLPGDRAGREPRRENPARVRQENRVTGFDPDDDPPLRLLTIGSHWPDDPVGPPYYGPYPLINTTLNLVAGQELAWQDRQGESFTFTPLFCGSRDTWYRRLDDRSDPYLTLGQAVAISGAAADPNMGTHQSAPLRALMTVFNARLGWWIQNPRHDDWVGQGPGIAWPIVRELLGHTDERSRYVHLSDGGHFENLGVYELIRRRCRYIVVSDAGMDPAFTFEDLARLIRLCRIDFGIRIEIDVDALRPMTAGPSQWHCAVGRIRYDDVDGGEIPGTLVYLKASLTGDEPPDVQNYRALHPEFPHQTTADQFFDEDQFESYRMLGLHVGLTVFHEAAHELNYEFWTETQPDLEFIRGNRKLFSAVANRWASAPPPPEEFIASADAWVGLQEDLRDQGHLDSLSRDIYPELNASEATSGDRIELHAIAQMLQVMEDAWLRLDLGGPGQVPLNRGWMSVFRRWASTAAFRRHWPTLRPNYGEDFVRFCESQLRLSVISLVRRLPSGQVEEEDLQRAIQSMGPDFAREWPGMSLANLIQEANHSWEGHPDGIPWRWLVLQGPPNETLDSFQKPYPCGITVAKPVVGQGLSENTFEFFVWVRRAYRSMGLGGYAAREILSDFCQAFWEQKRVPLTILVRYPVRTTPADDSEGPGISLDARGCPGPSDRENDIEFNLWKGFFSLFDFRANPRDRVFHPEEEVILERTFDPPD